MTHILLNGWHAGMGAVGQGAYANRLLQGFARHLDSSRYDATVLMPATRTARMPPLVIEPLAFKHRGHAVLDVMTWNRRLLSDRRLYQADTVFFSPGPLWGSRAPERMAITYHDCIYRHFPVYLGRLGVRRWMARQAEQFLLRAGIVFTESEHARGDITGLTGLPPERIVVIPAWLPPGFTALAARAHIPEVRTRYKLPERYWLYLGGYDIRKNVEFLIRAHARARRLAPCPPLILAGRIPTKRASTLCDVAGARREMGLDAAALIEPGFIAEEDLPALYAGAELFIFPSLMEGYGLPPLEAMGCGCPALVADNSSLREVVRDTDYRFATRTLDPLVERLVHAARHGLPMNPAFDPDLHDERTAIQRYLRHLDRLML